MTQSNDIVELPQHFRGTIPPVARIVQCFTSGPSANATAEILYRATNPAKYVLPPSIRYAHRFGPPEELAVEQTTLPYGWLYAADEPHTAACEALFFKNDARQPGTYYIDPAARRDGVIARLNFDLPLKLWDLRGTAANRLGVYDQLMSPDQDWCRWFGYYLHCAIMSIAPEDRPQGIKYPSRRHPSEAAVALHSYWLEMLRQNVRITEMRFADYLETTVISDDKLLVDPPEASSW